MRFRQDAMRSEGVDSDLASFGGLGDIDFDASYKRVSGTDPGIRPLMLGLTTTTERFFKR
jgi:hypothetical protein